MESALSTGWRRLEEARQVLLRDALEMSPAQREFRPGPGAWCALEIVQHIVLSEEMFLVNAREKGLRGGTTTARSALLSLLVGAIMRSPLRVKAPARAVVPRELVALAELTPRWEEVRRGLKELLGSIPREKLAWTLFRHPVSGNLDARRGLEFLRAHIAHHRVQLERVRSAAGYPAA